MLTGVFKGTLLCCENENFTSTGITDANKSVPHEIASFLKVIYKVIMPVIVGSGLLGNILILTVLSMPIFRGIAYLYLRGLALAHAGVLVSWIPIFFRLGQGTKDNYPSVFYHAHLELVAVNTFSVASILIMTCLIISAPLAIMRMVHEWQDGTGNHFSLRENVSVTRNGLWHAYIWIMEITARLCPTVILLILNTVVVKRFLHLNAKKREFQLVSEQYRTANLPDMSLLTRNRGYREEQHLATLMSVMAVCFVVTMIPSMVLQFLYSNYETVETGYHLFRAFAAVVELCNFANKCRKTVEEDIERPIGEIEDYSRHGTTVRLTPEQTKLNSPGSASRLNPMEEDGESELLNASDVV
ncbi:putative G-protein coupled receptor AH9.1 [Dufourea novaeangliae]|uniref:Putative G-protein coupled receptor AH9.1 n=1 Tax=Dufourea novaeangliae TaxID=178035 RepID=A0A154PN67_DUFNO|nr:putative G-protein coupled receptor AH9.1 [Dufourea novaeangliae]